MERSILIIGAGKGLSLGVAKRFGKEGYRIGLISRNKENLEKLTAILQKEGIESYYAVADVKNTEMFEDAINRLRNLLNRIDILYYNAANLKSVDILKETRESLNKDYTVNTAAALHAFQLTFDDLKKRKGAFIIAGGGFAIYPNAEFGSLSMGKAALRNLAHQISKRVREDNIYVGLLSIIGIISEESLTHSPKILAEKIWQLAVNRDKTELLT